MAGHCSLTPANAPCPEKCLINAKKRFDMNLWIQESDTEILIDYTNRETECTLAFLFAANQSWINLEGIVPTMYVVDDLIRLPQFCCFN